MKRSSKLSLALLAVAVSGGVSASNIYTSPDPAIISAPGTTVDVAIVIQADGVVNGFSGALQYNSGLFTVSNFAPCGNPAAGTITFSATNGGVAYPSDATVCTPTFTYTGVLPGVGDPDVVSPLTWAALDDGQGAATGDEGEIRVQGVPPTTHTVTYTAGAGGTASIPNEVVNGGGNGTVTFTPNGGFQLTAIGGDCPAGLAPALPSTVAVMYTTGTIDGAASGDGDCTVTATFAAIPFPDYQSTPAPGGALNCTSGGSTSLQIRNEGDADLTGLSCMLGGASFSISSAPAGTIAPAGSTTVGIDCPTVADGDPPVNDTLSCTHDDASAPITYPLSASAIPPIPPAIPTPQVVPASSLWSKLMLFGFLAGLGALVISLRRS